VLLKISLETHEYPVHNLSSISAVDGCIENYFENHKMKVNPSSMFIYKNEGKSF